MSQSAATKLVSKLRFKIHDRRNLKNPEGGKGRHDKIKKTVTALLKHERIELNYHRADESRGYAERLISDAIRNGSCHKPTMEMASYWIIEPQIVHKLFKVLAPRFKDCQTAYTKLWRAPNVYPGKVRSKCVLELRKNIYPSLEPDKTHNKNLIHNVLLEEARKVYEKNKAPFQAHMGAVNKVVQKPSETDASQSQVQHQQTESTVENKVDSKNIEMAKAESENKNENIVSEVSSSSESEVDLSKLKITDEKTQESTSEGEKR